MPKEAVLLSEEQMRRFVAEGCIAVKADFPAQFHREVYQQTETVFERGGNPGNNIMPMVPQLKQVFGHPNVHGALESILGPDYYLHPHRHCHYNKPGSEGQGLHKDSWSRFQHRTRWAMAFYYPQDTPVELGPTGVVPGSHYYNKRPGQEVGEEIPLCGEPGTVVIVHYDLWHRATPNLMELPRYMVKFLFVRLEEPQAPSWDGEGAPWETDNGLWSSVWDWHRGAAPANGGAGDRPALLAALASESEHEAFSAAYALGRIGAAAAAEVAALLGSESEYVRRNAGYALTAMGEAAVEVLVEAAGSARAETRASAVDALGDIGLGAVAAESVLVEALGDQEPKVRANAAHALGTIGGNGRRLDALVTSLQDEDEWVRRYSALSLLRMGPQAEGALDVLSKAALDDPNRYVQGKAIQTLQRIGTPAALAAALEVLDRLRWCPQTGIGSGF